MVFIPAAFKTDFKFSEAEHQIIMFADCALKDSSAQPIVAVRFFLSALLLGWTRVKLNLFALVCYSIKIK